MITDIDITLMREAMQLAQLGEGWVNPNPLVGALIVRDGEVIARGYHHRHGDLHAERDAFRNADAAGIDCAGATMYVTLEPCCHHGHQPPCTDAIIQHRIGRVVVGLLDPNPLVAGHGLELLRQAGIEVEMLPQLDGELRRQNRVFLKFITTQLPWVTAKWAMTLDGKICTHTGDSRWISGPSSRHFTHQLRRRHRAILVGIGTALADDPLLNVRLDEDPAARQPIRIVCDRQARLPLSSQLVCSCRQLPLIVAHAPEADPVRLQVLADAGVTLWCCRDLRDLMQQAGRAKIDSILVEGGGTIHEALLREGLVDEVVAFVAPKVVGGAAAKTPVEGQGIALMREALELHDTQVTQLGADIVISGMLIPRHS